MSLALIAGKGEVVLVAAYLPQIRGIENGAKVSAGAFHPAHVLSIQVGRDLLQEVLGEREEYHGRDCEKVTSFKRVAN